MTCVWDSLIAGIRDLHPELNNPHSLLSYLKANAVKPQHVIWNGESLSDQLQGELVEDLKNREIENGTEVGSCCGIFAVYAQIFHVSVVHNMQNAVQIKYEISNPKRTIVLASSNGHMVHASNIAH